MLIVEDDLNKYGQLHSFLTIELSGISITHAQSLQSGLRSVRNEFFDIIILDMTLPIYDLSPDEPESGIEAFGGLEFFRNMRRFKKDTPIIVFTQFEHFGNGESLITLEDLKNKLSAEFNNYIDAIYYHASIDEWKYKLNRRITEIKTQCQLE